MTKFFTLKELNPHNYPVSKEIANNLDVLINKVSLFRGRYGKPMKVTSGLRSQADQLRINPKAPKSKHLIGAAVDIQDKDGAIKSFILNNVTILSEIGLYCEDFNSTPGWVHFQILPPKSGKHVFLP